VGPGGAPAGRVQSVAVRLLVSVSGPGGPSAATGYWDLKAQLAKGTAGFEAKLDPTSRGNAIAGA